MADNKKARIQKLAKEIVAHRKLYAEGSPIISDHDFDKLEDELRQLDPNNKVLDRQVSPIDKGDHDLPFALPSLNKIRPDRGADDWLIKHEGPYVVSDKLDGLACEIVYSSGNPTKAYSSSDDGLTGKDISHLLPHMNVPLASTRSMVVRVELIVSRADFQNHWSSEFKNARNLSSGIKNKTSGIHKAAKHLKAVALGMLSPRGIPSVQLTQLKTMGFTVVPHKVVDTLTTSKLSGFYGQRKAKSPYDVDGIVVEQDIKTPAPKTNPKHQVAFKDMLHADFAQVIVTKVTWQESRYHKMTPVCWFEPVRLSGVDVQKATCHNAKMVKDNRIGVGAVLKVLRSGDVIPYVDSVIKPAKKAALPSGVEGKDWDWNESGVDIYANPDHSSSDDALIRQISHFFAAMDVEGFKAGTAAKFIDAGYTNVRDIMLAKPSEYADWLGPNMAQKLGAEIRAKLKQVYPADLAYAWGGFGRGVGTTRLWQMWEALGNKGVQNLLKVNETKRTAQILETGVGPVAARTLSDLLPQFFEFANTLPSKFIEYEAPEVNMKSNKLKGQVIGFTMFRDKQLEEDIVENGGELSNGFTSKTTILLAAGSSAKTDKAEAKGVPVMTAQEFRKKYKL